MAIDNRAPRSLRGAITMGNSFRRGALLAPVFGVLFAASAFAQTSTAPVAVPESFPAWAYPWVPDFKVPPDDGVPRHVPDSAAAFTITQERDLFFSPDWHPEDHGPMPDIVAKGDHLTRGRVVHATAPKAREGPRTQVWRVFQLPTSCSRWPTTKTARVNFRALNVARSY
jgi:hypothetical protein